MIILINENVLIGKRASVTITPLRGGPDEVIEGEVTEVKWMQWDPRTRLDKFDPYERVTISFAKPGEGGTHTVSSARDQVKILE